MVGSKRTKERGFVILANTLEQTKASIKGSVFWSTKDLHFMSSSRVFGSGFINPTDDTEAVKTEKKIHHCKKEK